jgi:hypothetical protein
MHFARGAAESNKGNSVRLIIQQWRLCTQPLTRNVYYITFTSTFSSRLMVIAVKPHGSCGVGSGTENRSLQHSRELLFSPPRLNVERRTEREACSAFEAVDGCADVHVDEQLKLVFS